MAETINICDLATEVSEDIFTWFKWDVIDLYDENFDCRKPEDHKKKKKGDAISDVSDADQESSDIVEKELKHTHPVDVVFKYRDPYLGKDILLNTDLKSYASSSIRPGDVRDMLQSIAKTIDCANISPEWKTRYAIRSEKYEIRGMLFIYNHDGKYHRNFYDVFKTTIPVGSERKKLGINLTSIGLKKNQQIHIVEPLIISYMTTIIADVDRLHREGTFPRDEYYFYYPELIRHKTIGGDKSTRPATIEAICAPYLIIEHDDVITKTKGSNEEKIYKAGYVIYYNMRGENPYEFVYLFDTLSRYQILNGEHNIRIRFAHYNPDPDICSNFDKAIDIYVKNWGYDEYKKKMLQRIETKELTLKEYCFKTKEVARKSK
ncbi:hypothetical protein [Yersinia enterocolitica]|uniref:hypothetical protein n=1 Tax=Yersinia enterocolitica TaxID=630 RepID=UPI00398D05C1